MSPPSKDNPLNHQEREEEEEDKLGIEEQGGACSNPAIHQEAQEKICRGLLYMQIGLGNFVQGLYFTLYFLFGTGLEIGRQIAKVKEYEETWKKPIGTPVAFVDVVAPNNDNFTFPILLCGQGIKIYVEDHSNMCYPQLNPDQVLSIEYVKTQSRNCLDGTLAHDMRLHNPKLPASLSFSLLCKNKSQIRTATNIKVAITTIDEEGKENHSHRVEKLFPVCFYDMEADDLQKNPKAGDSSMPIAKNILVDNHAVICQKVQNWDSVIRWLVTNGALDKSFLDDRSLSEERKSEILRNLYQVENILPMLIEALRTSGDNEELVTFLHQCTEAMENQSSSLE